MKVICFILSLSLSVLFANSNNINNEKTLLEKTLIEINKVSNIKKTNKLYKQKSKDFKLKILVSYFILFIFLLILMFVFYIKFKQKKIKKEQNLISNKKGLKNG